MRLGEEFFHRDCLLAAPELVGKVLVRSFGDGRQERLRILETEAYRGEEDTACHAHKGRTKRTEVLYREHGRIYVYLCYGIHWLLNFVTGEKDLPQAVLIRACVDAEGPGKLTKRLKVDGSFNDTSVYTQDRLWVEDDGKRYPLAYAPRVGIGYASQEDQDKLWRFKMVRRIGLTGGVGAGKSQVLSWLEEKGKAKVIRTDDVAKALMEPGEEGYRQVVKALGDSILAGDKRIDRPVLASLIFGDKKVRDKVDGIIHPLVWKKVRKALEEAGEDMVVVESAIFSSEALTWLDELWYVDASEAVRRERLMESRGYSSERCQAMMDSQPGLKDYREKASRVIRNGGGWADTERQLRGFFE